MNGVLKKLSEIQTQIKAPKNLFNKFGGYNYRNAEGICESVKPYLTKYKCALTLSDSIENVRDRYYITATATLTDYEDGSNVSVKAYAREAVDKKGMDDSQISGTASSYARKYALNGLFLLDDTKDADTDEYHQQTHRDEKPDAMAVTKEQKSMLSAELARTGISAQSLLAAYGCKSVNDMKIEQYVDAMNKLKAKPTREVAKYE